MSLKLSFESMKNPIPYKIAIGKTWSYDFPKETYNLNYFSFTSAIGGIGSTPPEIKCTLKIKDSEQKFLEEVNELFKIYKDTNLTILKDNNGVLKIEIFEWTFFDYDFQLISKIEDILEKYVFELINDFDSSQSEVIFKNVCQIYKDGYNYIEPKIFFSYSQFGFELVCFMDKINEEEFLKKINQLLIDFNFDEAEYYRCQNSQEVSFRIYFRKYHTYLSKKGKYQFDTLDLDNSLFTIFNHLNIQNGRMKNDLNVIEVKQTIQNSNSIN